MEMCWQGEGRRRVLSSVSPATALLMCWFCPAATFCHVQGRTGQEKNLSHLLWRLRLLDPSGSAVAPPAPGILPSSFV